MKSVMQNKLRKSRAKKLFRKKTFAELEKLAIEGLNYHWGRNQNHAVAKDVKINKEAYEVYMHAINTKENTMDDVDLIYNTNNKWMRSGNLGSLTKNPISWGGNLISREAVCYNVGYIKGDEWNYRYDINESILFKETAAHEIGHEILKTYGGTIYSYGHKGSGDPIWQCANEYAIAYPKDGEIDLMCYYTDWLDYAQRKRNVAAERDVLSLLWLTKIEIQ